MSKLFHSCYPLLLLQKPTVVTRCTRGRMWHLCEQLNKLKLQFLLARLVFLTALPHAGIDSPEDLCILHSNRAACYLKDGNSQDCIQDCTK